MAEKKQDFVVSDRRRFAPEGELRSPEREEGEVSAEPVAASAAPTATAPAQPAAPATPEEVEDQEEMPPPPSAAEQQAQTHAFQDSTKKLDDIFNKAGLPRETLPEMTFERLVKSYYETALWQMGYIRQEGEPPAVDILGARQTIDSITILQEKTKGNLTEHEQSLLQNVLFQLRMAWIEITNALASGKLADAPPEKK
jgi:hypothetical protein